jgi:hypothetical protein
MIFVLLSSALVTLTPAMHMKVADATAANIAPATASLATLRRRQTQVQKNHVPVEKTHINQMYAGPDSNFQSPVYSVNTTIQ